MVKNAIDDEHQQLLARINQFCEKLTESLLDHEIIFMISEIHATIAAHFKQEEEIMRQQHDANYTKHKVDHDSLLDEIKSLMENIEPGSTKNLGRALAARCVAWFTVHYEDHDKDFQIKGEAQSHAI